jgi:hypothetical protein
MKLFIRYYFNDETHSSTNPPYSRYGYRAWLQGQDINSGVLLSPEEGNKLLISWLIVTGEDTPTDEPGQYEVLVTIDLSALPT